MREIWQIFPYFSHQWFANVALPGHPGQDRQEKHHLHARDCHVATKAPRLSWGQRFMRWQERDRAGWSGELSWTIVSHQHHVAPRILKSASESSRTWAGIRQVGRRPLMSHFYKMGGATYATSNLLVDMFWELSIPYIVYSVYSAYVYVYRWWWWWRRRRRRRFFF